MSSSNGSKPDKKEDLKDLLPKSDQVLGGREPTKHPAKVTVPDLKLG